MLEWEDIKEAELGRMFDSKAMKECCTGVYGGISWPGTYPGFAVVVAVKTVRALGGDRAEVCLLDEVECREVWKLIDLWRGLDLKHSPSVWIGDDQNPTADSFMRSDSKRHKVWLSRSEILDMHHPYQFMLQHILHMLQDEKKTLFLKDGKVIEYLRQIEQEKEWEYEQGEFPAIEALAFAVLEGKRLGGRRRMTLEQIRQCQRKAGMIEAEKES